MRIITWNCNMAFRKKYEKIMRHNPDLLVLQECENDNKLNPAFELINPNQTIWYGNNPHKGVAILSFNDVEIKLKADHNPAFEYILPLDLMQGEKKVNLFSIWAMPHKTVRAKNYVGQIWGALNYYENQLNEDSIWVGDFNSNAIWDKKKRVGNHSDVVKLLQQKEIVSLYHLQHSIIHGEEIHPTLFLLKNKQKPYHLDYCFASQNLISEKTKIEIGAYEDWIKLSDHMPLIIDDLKLG